MNTISFLYNFKNSAGLHMLVIDSKSVAHERRRCQAWHTENLRFSKLLLAESSEDRVFDKMSYPNHPIIQKIGVGSNI